MLVYDQFTRRITDVTTQLTTHGIPLTAPTAPPAGPDPTDPWAGNYAAVRWSPGCRGGRRDGSGCGMG